MPDRRVGGRLDEAAADTAALLPYAELLRDLIDRRLHPSGSTDLVAPSTDRLFDDALPVVLERMLNDRLRELDPATFAVLYRGVRGADAFADALAELAAQDLDTVRRRAWLGRLAAQAQVSGRLRLAELTVGEVVTAGLFDPARPDLAARRFRDNQQVRPLHRLLQVRLVDPVDGTVEVVHDTWAGAIWSAEWRRPTAEPLAAARLGTRPFSADDAPLRPELTRLAPLVLQLDDGKALTPPQIVGFVETLDGQVLLDG